MITNNGKALWANAIGNLGNGFTGTVKASTSNSLEANGGPKWTAEQFTGQDVYADGYVGTILKTEETVLSVARWELLPTAEEPARNRSEKAPEPPIPASAFSIVSGATPAAWVGISTNKEEPKASNTTLKDELGVGKTKSGKFGLVRSLATFSPVEGKPEQYKIEVTFTAGTEDELPKKLAKIGIFNAQNGGVMMFESLLTAEAEIAIAGDSVTISDIVAGS